ncbi:MAG: methyltransferase domain-containing protein [Lysobacteraceae bacterium]|nr:MAG: methyltransferase domain-containing protein [Xanthomonadaceae bacterium]
MAHPSFELPFLRAFLANPGKVASPVPSGPRLAAAVAAQVPDGAGLVLELGPGSGAVTSALLEQGVAPADLVAIEYDPDFCALLRERFSASAILQGDAFAFRSLLPQARFRAIVSGVPVLGLPLKAQHALLHDAMTALLPGKPFIQFTYSMTPPLNPPEAITVERAAIVWANLPPMHVWCYRCAAS